MNVKVDFVNDTKLLDRDTHSLVGGVLRPYHKPRGFMVISECRKIIDI